VSGTGAAATRASGTDAAATGDFPMRVLANFPARVVLVSRR
jgi:hypothetical protein